MQVFQKVKLHINFYCFFFFLKKSEQEHDTNTQTCFNTDCLIYKNQQTDQLLKLNSVKQKEQNLKHHRELQ